MITRSKAEEIFRNTYPNLNVIAIGIYKEKGYIFVAIKNSRNEEDPYYYVDDSGEVVVYIPAADYENFSKIRWVYSSDTDGPNVLVHHGILGQKWGVRRFQNYDGTRTSAGKKRYKEYLKNESHNFSEQSKRIDRESNILNLVKAMTTGATTTGVGVLGITAGSPLAPIVAAGGTTLTVVAGKRFVDGIRNKKYVEKMKTDSTIIDKKTGFKLKEKEYTEKRDVAMVNPGFKNFNTDTKHNCYLCTATMEMRKRGYDVTAKKADIGYMDEDTKEFFKGAKTDIDISRKKSSSLSNYVKNVYEEMNKLPDGARGMVGIVYEKGGGHSIYAEKNNGKLKFIDAQVNKIYNNKYSPLRDTESFVFQRLDDKEINVKNIKELMHGELI